MKIEQWVSLAAIVFTILGVFVTVWQKDRSESRDRRERLEFENRAEWWRRWEMALRLAGSDQWIDREAALGTARALAASPLITPSEFGMMEVVNVIITATANGEGDGPD